MQSLELHGLDVDPTAWHVPSFRHQAQPRTGNGVDATVVLTVSLTHVEQSVIWAHSN